MGRKGGSTTLKRRPAPRFWPIHRKESAWTVKPSPGPHSLENCLPLAIVLRDILGFAKTRKESKTTVFQGKVLVDGKLRRKDAFPVGLMDVVSIPEIDRFFRVLPSRKGLVFHPISKEESDFKLCRIENKTVVQNGHVQLNLHDGSNILLKVADLRKPEEDIYRTLDTVKLGLPDRQILEQIEMKENDSAVITKGKNIGRFGRITEIERTKGKKRRYALTTIEDENGDRYQTILDFVFALGEDQPLISKLEET